MTFSRAQTKLRAVEKKQYRARLKARLGQPDYLAKHPQECRDASGDNPKYTLLDKRVKEECEKKQVRHELFTRKLHKIG